MLTVFRTVPSALESMSSVGEDEKVGAVLPRGKSRLPSHVSLRRMS